VPRPRPDRLWLLALLAPVLIASGGAAAAQSLPESLAACARIARDDARLACYDRVSAGLASRAPAAPTAGPTAGRAAPPTAAARSDAARPAAMSEATDDFGLPPKPAPHAREPKRREMVIAEVHRTATGKLVFRMENGQVWRQVESRPMPPVRPGMKATVKKGVLGGYLLRVARQTVRVRRVR